VAADVRVRTYMHEHNIYKPEAPDVKIIPLIKSLKKGTDIEEFEGKQWNILKARTLDRMAVLAGDMLKKGLLKIVDGTPQKIEWFRDVWVNRHSHYGPKENATKPVAAINSRDIYSIDNLPPDQGSSFRNPTAKLMSTARQPSSTTAV
jgi:hypothetical protein